MKYILNISIYLSLHAMISMWSVFYTYTLGEEICAKYLRETPLMVFEPCMVVFECLHQL